MRKAIATEGSYGSTANVYQDTLNGETVARVEWREHKRRHTETFRGPKREREAEAKAFAEGVVSRLKGFTKAAPKRKTIGELWDAYLVAKTPDWRPNTKRLNLGRWKSFVNHVSPYTYADLVQMETIDAWRKSLLETDTKRGEPMARNQVAHHVAVVKSVWKFAKQRKLLGDNPIADYRLRKGSDDQPAPIPEYTGDEWERILGYFNRRSMAGWRSWAAIALDGMLAPRSNALLHLEWGDVDLSRREVTWRKATDKMGKERVQPLSRDAVFVLRWCRVWCAREANARGFTSPFVFPSWHRKRADRPWTYSALNAALHKSADAVGVPRIDYRALHSLRRMSAGNVLAMTGDITKVGLWLGDSDMRVLRKSYLHGRKEDYAKMVSGSNMPKGGKQKRDTKGNEVATAKKTTRKEKP